MDHSTNAVEMSRYEKKLEYNRKWYAKNKERARAYHNNWETNHPDNVKAMKLRYYVNVLRREGYTVIPPEGVE